MRRGQTIQDWLDRFGAAVANGDADGAAALFGAECYWRDLLAFTWNIKTMEGRADIATALRATLGTTRPVGWQVRERDSDDSAWISFDTASGVCTGRITLRDGAGFVLFTALADLKGHAEPRGATRPLGLVHRADRQRQTWAERRAREVNGFETGTQPYVVIIGGGQGGLALGARLKALGVPALIVEQNARAGDSWRNRYRSLTLHDPVWYDHMPYLPFPEGWPVFTPKDKMGDWLEAYALMFELDLWTSTTCEAASFHGDVWSVQVRRNGKPITLRPRHLVFATGAYGPPKTLSLPGQAQFRGPFLHSSAYQSGADFAGKQCVVIGAASSAHDVAVDLWEAGAKVTMIQRSPTIVVRSETLMELGFERYSEAALARGISTDRADMSAAATPYGLFAGQQRALYRRIRERDAEFYRRLAASGFALDFGEDDSGLMMKALRTASGYYIDVGASELIIAGEIRVMAGRSVTGLTAGGLRLDDGSEVTADAIIACTGYQSMHETVAAMVSRRAADLVGPCFGLGSGVRGDPGPWQGELRNLWKPTAHPALWFHGGNLALSRFYSRFVALQLKARLEGIATPVYGLAAPPGG